MNVCGVTFGGYLAKILSFKTGNLLNNSKFHLLSEGTVYWKVGESEEQSAECILDKICVGFSDDRWVRVDVEREV